MDKQFIRRRVRSCVGLLAALAPVWLLGLLLTRVAPASAASLVVGDGLHAASCNMFSLANAMTTAFDADISFNCGGPATIAITQAGGLNVLAGYHLTLHGADAITITGLDNYRLFWVHADGALTLTHMVLTHGYAASGGDYPQQGGAILNEGASLTLDHATIRDSGAALAAGAIEDSGGTTVIFNSLIENNHSVYGGGIDSLGALTLVDTTVRANQAITGGGLDVGGLVQITNTVFYSNSASIIGGGLRIAAGAVVTTASSQFIQNRQTAASGGGGAIFNEGDWTDYNSLLSGNTAQYVGAGLYNNGLGFTLLVNTRLEGNSAFAGGGGIYNSAALRTGYAISVFLEHVWLNSNHAPTGGGLASDSLAVSEVSASTLSGNTGLNGAGIYNGLMAKTFIYNSTLSGNTAGQDGGGMDNDGKMELLNATFSHNSALQGGALHMNATASTVVTNTILTDSPQGANCNGTVTASKFSLSSDLSCALSGLVKGLNPNGRDPLLAALGNYGGTTLTYMPKLGSPAIDGVLGNDAPIDDQRGEPRPALIGFDIGSLERQADDTGLAPWLYLPVVRR